MKTSYFQKLPYDEDTGVFLQYETRMGSMAYGANIGDTKDIDVYGWAFPTRKLMFPYEHGIVAGFNDKDAKTFKQFQKEVEIDGHPIDFSIYGVAKYLRLVAEGNPNMLDSLFTRDEDVTFITSRGQLLRDNRQMFLSKRAVRKCLGFANSELKKVQRSYYFTSSDNADVPRLDLIKKHGYDTKSAYHLVRILHQGFQIAFEHDLDIYTEERAEDLREVREGANTFDGLMDYASKLMKETELVLKTTTLREEVNRGDVHRLLMTLLNFYD